MSVTDRDISVLLGGFPRPEERDGLLPSQIGDFVVEPILGNIQNGEDIGGFQQLPRRAELSSGVEGLPWALLGERPAGGNHVRPVPSIGGGARQIDEAEGVVGLVLQ